MKRIFTIAAILSSFLAHGQHARIPFASSGNSADTSTTTSGTILSNNVPVATRGSNISQFNNDIGFLTNATLPNYTSNSDTVIKFITTASQTVIPTIPHSRLISLFINTSILYAGSNAGQYSFDTVSGNITLVTAQPVGQLGKAIVQTNVSAQSNLYYDSLNSTFQTGTNLFNPATVQPGIEYNATCSCLFAFSTEAVVVIPVTAGTSYYLSGMSISPNPRTGGFLAADGTTHVGTNTSIPNTATSIGVTAPTGAYYYAQSLYGRCTTSACTNISQVQFELGTSPTPHASYAQYIVALRGDSIRAANVPRGQPFNTINLLDTTILQQGKAINVATGAIGSYSGFSLATASVTPSTIYIIGAWQVPDPDRAVRFNDASGNLISFIVMHRSPADTFTTPAGCVQIQFTCNVPSDVVDPLLSLMLVQGSTLPNYTIHYAGTYYPGWGTNVGNHLLLYNEDTLPNSAATVAYVNSVGTPKATAGKQFIIFGDSQTADTNADGSFRPNWPNATDPNLPGSPAFIPYMMQTNEIYDVAFSGATWVDRSGTTSPAQQMSVQIDSVLADTTILGKPDYIAIAMGTNDANSIAENTEVVGDSASTFAITNINSLDRTKLYPAIRYAFWKIKTYFPNTVIYCTNMIPRPDRTDSVMAIVQKAIKVCAHYYNVQVMDTYNEAGFCNQFENIGLPGRFLLDGLHPNEAGSLMYAKYIYSKIIATYQK